MPSKSLQSLKYCICRTLKEAPNVNRGLISTTAAESVHEFVLQTHLIMRQGRRCPILACRQQTSHRLCCVLLSLTTQREQKALHRCWEGGGSYSSSSLLVDFSARCDGPTVQIRKDLKRSWCFKLWRLFLCVCELMKTTPLCHTHKEKRGSEII